MYTGDTAANKTFCLYRTYLLMRETQEAGCVQTVVSDMKKMIRSDVGGDNFS